MRLTLKEWLMAHLPPWLNPSSPWGTKGRPDLPEKHATINRQQAVNLRLDRLDQRARHETEEQRFYREWDQHAGG